VPDEDTARKVEAAIKGGESFEAAAKTIAGQDDSAIKLGAVEKSDLPPALGDTVFALEPGKVSDPVQSPLGWHIMRVTASEPAATQPLEMVKPRLEAEIKREMASDRLYGLSNQLDDSIAGGASLADAGKNFNLTPIEITGVDQNGRTAEGQSPTLPVERQALLRAAFALGENQSSRITETPDGGFFLVHIDKITPATVKPFDQVQAEAKDALLRERRQQASEAAAKSLAEAVPEGAKLKDIAAGKQLEVATTQPFLRSATRTEPALPPALVARLFEVKSGAVLSVPGSGGTYVAQLTEIQPADPAADATAVGDLSRQLQGALAGDVLAQLDQALRKRFPVSIHQHEIDQLF
jgi:peptidyl-prolyl cis-trans isomerase D